MLVIEEILSRAAQALNLPPDVVRERNFYREGDETHYGEPVRDAGRIELIWNALKTIERLSPSAATRSRASMPAASIRSAGWRLRR